MIKVVCPICGEREINLGPNEQSFVAHSYGMAADYAHNLPEEIISERKRGNGKVLEVFFRGHEPDFRQEYPRKSWGDHFESIVEYANGGLKGSYYLAQYTHDFGWKVVGWKKDRIFNPINWKTVWVVCGSCHVLRPALPQLSPSGELSTEVKEDSGSRSPARSTWSYDWHSKTTFRTFGTVKIEKEAVDSSSRESGGGLLQDHEWETESTSQITINPQSPESIWAVVEHTDFDRTHYWGDKDIFVAGNLPGFVKAEKVFKKVFEGLTLEGNNFSVNAEGTLIAVRLSSSIAHRRPSSPRDNGSSDTYLINLPYFLSKQDEVPEVVGRGPVDMAPGY